MSTLKKTRIGDVFGSLTVIDEAGYSKRRRYVLVRCDCGTEYSVRVSSLVTQKNPTCVECRHAPNWLGIGKVPKAYYNSIVSGAKNRNIFCDISLEEISELFEAQDHKCIYTQLLLSFKPKIKTASLNRINNNIGYVSNNVQWVHKTINTMKTDLGETTFLQMCQLVANNLVVCDS